MIRSDGDNRADALQRELDALREEYDTFISTTAESHARLVQQVARARQELSDCRRHAFEKAVMRGESP